MAKCHYVQEAQNKAKNSQIPQPRNQEFLVQGYCPVLGYSVRGLELPTQSRHTGINLGFIH